MSIRGKAAVVGFDERPSVRNLEGRSTLSLLTEAASNAIRDAGLRKEDIDGLITRGAEVSPLTLAEYAQLKPVFTEGTTLMGASGANSIALAASAINAGYVNCVLCAFGGTRDPNVGGFAPGERRGETPRSFGTEWENPFGPVIAANGGYGLMKQRHMYQYGTRDEQFAKMAVNQRFNALTNPNAVFNGQPITLEDVLNSRYVNDPLHLLECVMPCNGAAVAIVTSAERARSLPNPPVYILGAGGGATSHEMIWQESDITVTPVVHSAPRAFQMAGYGPKDMQFAEFYDCYTILEAVCLEDAGFCKKGEIGDFFDSTDTTYKGTFPINTDGGQISGGQPVGGGGGFRNVVEAVRQIMGRAGERQVAKHDVCAVNG